MKKKLLSILLCLCMVMALLPTTALATEGAGSTSISNFAELQAAFRDGGEYTLAANITVTEGLTLASDKTLTIHGNKKTIQPEVTGLNEQGIVNTGASAIDNIIDNSGTLTLDNLTIYGGKGRCINNSRTLTMTGVSLERAHLTGEVNFGAGLYNDLFAKALLTNCNIRRNGCESSAGGFYNYMGTLILENCAIVENRNFGGTNGGGAGENKGSLYMNNCTVANNQSSEIGGGLNNYSGTAYIMNSTFTGNVTTASEAHAGGGIGNNQGTVYAVNSVFAFNYANGMASDIGICNSSSTNVNLYNCAYGTIRKYNNSADLSGIDSTCQKLTGDVSSLFNGARDSGIVNENGVEQSTAFARPVITQEDSTYGVYPAESSALKSGAVKTYYECDSTNFTVKMSYGESPTQLGNLGTTSIAVTRPGGGYTSGLIGAMPANFAITTMYTVKVNPAAGGTVTGGSAQGNSYPAGTTGIQITAVPNTGRAFSGWKVGDESNPSIYANPYTLPSLTEDVTLTPVFVEANTYTVTYWPGTNGTGDKKTDTKTKDVDLTLQGVTFTRTGYTQTGWATSDGGDKAYDLGGTYSDNTAVSLYPVWTANNYDISLSQAGTHTFTAATVGYSTAPAALSVTVTNTGNQPTGALTVALSGTNADSFTLGDVDDGFTDGIETQDGTDTFTVKPKTGLAVGTYTATVTVSGTNIVPKSFNVSFTVSAVAPTTYTVTFNPNEGDCTTSSKQVTYASTYGDLPTPTRAGYTFLGWFTSAEGGSEVTSSTTVKITAAQTLYAHWTANTYDVALNTNGGTLADGKGIDSYTYGSGATLPTASDITKTGYTFGGWTATNDANDTTYITTINTTDTGDKTFYAKWTPNTYTVTFNPNEGDCTTSNKGVTYDSTYGDLPTPTRAGYTFLGWFTSAEGGSEVTSSTTVKITAAQTLYAHWTPVAATAPVITTGGNLSLTYGYTEGSISVTATPAEGHTITGYKWYSNTSNSNTGGSTIDGATESSYTIPTGKSAGTTEYYYCVVTTKRGDNEQTTTAASGVITVTITKAGITPVVSITGWTYKGSANAPSVSGNTGNGSVTYAYKVKGANDNTYTSTVPTEAGDYTVKATVAQTTNYNGGSATADFKINPKDISGVTIADITAQTYNNGTAITPTPAVQDGDTTLTVGTDFTYDYENNINAGDSAVVKVNGQGNYTGTASKTFTISRADLTITVNITGWVVGGTPNAPSVTGNTGNGTVTYQYKVAEADDNTYTDAVPTAVGNYTVKATVAQTANYNAASATTDFSISTKAVQTITAENVTVTYGDSDQKVSGTTSGDGTISYSVKNGSEFVEVNSSTGALTIKKVGTATITVTASETDSHAVASKDITVTVAPLAVTAPTADTTVFTYNGQNQAYGVTETANYTVSNGIQKNAGTYTVTVELRDKDNTVWVDSSDTADKTFGFEIKKATITIAAKNKSAYVNDAAPALGEGDYTVSGLATGENLETLPTIAYASTPDMTKAGTVSITVSGAEAPDGGNYNDIIYNNGTFTISTRPSSGGGGYTPPTYKVESEVAETADGSVSFSKNSAKKGDTVTITVTPDRYYKVDGVTVKDSSGKEIAVTDNGDGTFTFKMPGSKVTVEPVFSWDNPFADVAENAYYAPAVEWALKNDITDGVDAAHFAPNASCTRAQIVTFLWRAAGCPAPKSSTMPFTDVKAGSYYETAVLWAVENGITKGTGDTTFSPNATCSRAQIVSFLYRAASSPAVSGSAVFTDVSAGSYYANAVAWAVENGITGGTGNNAFSPNADCTRAQIVSFLYRWMVK